MTLGVVVLPRAIMLLSTEGERKEGVCAEVGSGGNEVWRRCEGPALDGLRRLDDCGLCEPAGRFLGTLS
jgi:hypothetical protein